MSNPRDAITATGLVECSECGHVIESHDTTGCDLCDACPARWTVAQIKAYRRSLALPGEWRGRPM